MFVAHHIVRKLEAQVPNSKWIQYKEKIFVGYFDPDNTYVHDRKKYWISLSASSLAEMLSHPDQYLFSVSKKSLLDQSVQISTSFIFENRSTDQSVHYRGSGQQGTNDIVFKTNSLLFGRFDPMSTFSSMVKTNYIRGDLTSTSAETKSPQGNRAFVCTMNSLVFKIVINIGVTWPMFRLKQNQCRGRVAVLAHVSVMTSWKLIIFTVRIIFGLPVSQMHLFNFENKSTACRTPQVPVKAASTELKLKATEVKDIAPSSEFRIHVLQIKRESGRWK